MKKALLIIIGLCLCAAIVWTIKARLIDKAHLKPHEGLYTIPKQIRYSFTIQNKTNRLLKKGELWAHAPVKKTATQRCELIESSHSFDLLEDDLGNQVIHFTIHDLPPFGTRIINIKADLLLSEEPNVIETLESDIFSLPEKYIESDHSDLIRTARSLNKKTSLETAQNIHNWVSNHLEYTGYLRNARGALYALSQKKGDCTEYMYLFVALCRAEQIPAKAIGGYVCRQNTILKSADYHNWAEFFSDGIWRIADPLNKAFAKDNSSYIATRIITEAAESPMLHFDRFRVKGDGLKVRMNP